MLNKITSVFGRRTASGKMVRGKTAPFGFHGGLLLEPNKRALHNESVATKITTIPAPEFLTIPLINYENNIQSPLVRLHENVKRGQALATGIVSPASGMVDAIEPRQTIHPYGLEVMTIAIRNDALDTRMRIGMPDQHSSQDLEREQDFLNEQQHETIQLTDKFIASAQSRIADFIAKPAAVLDHAALHGLGGAGFPTAEKLLPVNRSIKTLIINAAECEPEIACDEALMQRFAEHIALGISALVQVTKCEKCVVAIEDAKTRAIESMRDAVAKIDNNVELMVIPTRYPAGAESPLIENVTGQFIPHHEKPITHGVMCINVATAFALWQAINGQALDSRVVTLGGAGMANPCNVWVRFGTPVSHVLQQTGNNVAANTMRIRAGGPLSGFDLQTTDVPIVATTNCILAEPARSEPDAQACIRCGDCADVCPARLQPQQLYWYVQAAEHDKCQELQIDACIECGCCDLVCPASIKLTETFRFEKSNVGFIKAQQQSAADAEHRFAQRKHRLEQKTQARNRIVEQRKQKLRSKQQPDSETIAAALARARSKRNTRQDQ